jgi:hypothetical protein
LVAAGLALVTLALILLRVFGSAEVFSAGALLVCVACSGFQAHLGDWTLLIPTLLVGMASAAVLVALFTMRASERALLAELFPRPHPDGCVGAHVVGGRSLDVHVSIQRGTRAGPKRFLDGRVVVLSARVAANGVSLYQRRIFERTWPPPSDSIERRYWLDAPVCAALQAVPNVRLHDGTLELSRGSWCTRARIEAWLAELATVALPLFTAEDRVAARVAAEPDPRLQRYDWQGLVRWAPARAETIAAGIPANADPAVVVGAAELRGDDVTLKALLRTTHDGEALQMLAAWARHERRREIAPQLAARVGIPPEEAWPELLRGLAELGGRDEMAVLLEVAAGVGYPPEVRALAERATLAIRDRLGPQRQGALALAHVQGGAVSVTESAGEGALSRTRPTEPD